MSKRYKILKNNVSKYVKKAKCDLEKFQKSIQICLLTSLITLFPPPPKIKGNERYTRKHAVNIKSNIYGNIRII